MKMFALLLVVAALQSAALQSAAFAQSEDVLTPDEKMDFRARFYEAVTDEDATNRLLTSFQKRFGKNPDDYPPFALAYCGATETLLGKHALNPLEKLDWLDRGLARIAEALSRRPNSLEFRFLRFSILHHLPDILGYGETTEQDALSIYRLLMTGASDEVGSELTVGIVEFLLRSDRISDEREARLRKKYPEAEG
jgi:hypothetical protein